MEGKEERKRLGRGKEAGSHRHSFRLHCNRSLPWLAVFSFTNECHGLLQLLVTLSLKVPLINPHHLHLQPAAKLLPKTQRGSFHFVFLLVCFHIRRTEVLIFFLIKIYANTCSSYNKIFQNYMANFLNIIFFPDCLCKFAVPVTFLQYINVPIKQLSLCFLKPL